MSKKNVSASSPEHGSEFWPAPAKINLMLHITGRREDGYHELQTVFQFIDYADELSFKIRHDDVIVRHSDGFSVPQDEDIIIRAAKALREHYRVNNTATRSFGVDIELVKKIPMGAGLGGGSSDAATTLLVLNRLWEMSFSIDELADIGLALGADVPVFIRGFAAFAEGVGEKISPISPPEKWYLLLIPPVHISTKEIFCNPELTRDTSAIKICDLSRHQWRNDCTAVVVKHYPEVSQAFEIINKYSKASMSGTGAAVFAGFDTEAQAEAVLQKIKENTAVGSWICFVAKGLNESPLHHLL
jgi:4-diphosphocytidyl-2-C-methyl-D-erythritol kinase